MGHVSQIQLPHS